MATQEYKQLWGGVPEIDPETGTQAPSDLAPQPAAQSFDLMNKMSAEGFIGGMEKSHPWLHNALRTGKPGAWEEMLATDARYQNRWARDGEQLVLSDEDSEDDRDYFKWAATQGKLPEANFGTMVEAFAGGLGSLAKGAYGLAKHSVEANVKALTLQAPTGDRDMLSLAATAVEGAQQSVGDYKQLGAGLASLLTSDPTLKLEAQYQVARYAHGESKRQGEWRSAISQSFAAVPVDSDEVELLSEVADVTNLIGFGAGKAVTKGPGMVAKAVAKVPVVGRDAKKAVLVGQVDALSKEAIAVNASVIELETAVNAARKTIDANPNAPLAVKEANLKRLELAKTDLARLKGEAAGVDQHLTEARAMFSKHLDGDGRTLTDTLVGGGLRATGATVGGVINLVDKTRELVSRTVTGEPDFLSLGAPLRQANRLASDAKVLGELWSQGTTTIPFYRRVAASDQVTGLTKGVAWTLDRSGLGWVGSGAFDLARAGAAGAPVSGAFGYVASGGDLNAAAESAGFGAGAGISGGAYGAWQVYRSPEIRADEMYANRRVFKSVLSRRDVNGVSQARLFDQMGDADQLAIATYAQANPDVQFRLQKMDGVSGFYDRENNTIVLNPESKTPLRDIFRHEVAHYAERHGLTAEVRAAYLGNAETGQIGEFTKLDESGQPVVVETPNPDGTVSKRYELNADGQASKDEYDAMMRKADPAWTSSNEYFASETFAEQYAQRLIDGGLKRDLRNSPIDALASNALVKDFMGKVGLMFDRDGKVTGTGIFSRQKRNVVVDRLISQHTKATARGQAQEIVEDEQYVFTEADLKNPELALKWANSGGTVKFDTDGKPVYKNGNIQYLTAKEAEAQARDFTNELIVQIEKHAAENPGDSDVLQRREVTDVAGKKSVVYSGRTIPAAVIDAMQTQKRFNPHQLAHLRAMAATVNQYGSGAMISHFYQAAERKGGGGRARALAGRWRQDAITGFKITKDANVIVESISWEQLYENAHKAAKTKLARETWALAGGDLTTAIVADVKKYLDNVAAGKPGETDIGVAKRDFINNQFGLRMASNEGVNPVADTTKAPKVVLTSLRLDRMNRVAPLGTVETPWGVSAYQQVKQNRRPEDKASSAQKRLDAAKDRYEQAMTDLRAEQGGPGEEAALKAADRARSLKQQAEEAFDRISEEGAQFRPEEDSQLEGFAEELKKKISDKIAKTPRSDYAEGDELYTPSGTKVTFVTDLPATGKGERRSYVKLPDGSEGSVLTSSLSPEKPKFPDSGRALGPNSEFAAPPTDEEAIEALQSNKREKFGAARDLAPGTPVGLRIDIPAFRATGTYVVTVHENASGKSVGKVIGYDTIAAVDRPTFMSNERGAEKIRDGDSNKFPIATVEGEFNPSREIPSDIDSWTPVGFDPVDHSYFYDKQNDRPVIGGERAVSVGNTVFVKDPVYGNPKNFAYRPEKEWLAPDGKLVTVESGLAHEQQAAKILGKKIGGNDSERELYKKGWARIRTYGGTTYVTQGGSAPNLTKEQRASLEDMSFEGQEVTFDGGGSERTLFRAAAGNQFRPELKDRPSLTKPDGTLAFPQRRYKGKIKLTHYTRAEGLTSIDPKFMGTGAGNSKTTNFRMISGENKSFYFIGDSKPLGSENVDINGSRYGFTFDPSRMYDMDTDPANLWFYPNPAKSEGALKAAGYDGFLAKTKDGREFAALFHSVDVKSGELTRSAPLDTEEATETKKPRKTKADREWDEWQKKLARGNGFLSDESDKQYRPESGNPVTRDVAARYTEQALGRPYSAHTVYEPLPEAQIRRIADYFDTAKHEPKDPGVRGSYDALIAETKAQFEAMEAAGIEIEPWTKSVGEPYASSADMMKDVAENRHLWFFLTDNGFGSGTALEHPMLEPSGIFIGDRELLNNDLFRAVHDYFGHTQMGFQFGPRGEFNAWKSHASMFTDEAQGALAAETLAQNAWVNNGAHLRDANGAVAKKGEAGYVEPKDRPFAEQKAFVLPAQLRQFRPESMSEGEVRDRPLRVSTRLPTAKSAIDDPLADQLTVRTEHVLADSSNVTKIGTLLKKYPNLASKGKARDVIDELHRVSVENLLWLHDHMAPELRERARQWYDGGRKLVEAWSAEHSLPTQSIAGALAALSPQKDWYMNVDLARRVIEHHEILKGGEFTEELAGWFVRKFGDKDPEKLASVIDARGKKFPDLTLFQKAVFLRAYDEVNVSRSYQVIAPEGDFMGPAKKMDGGLAKVAWGDFGTIAKAISVVEDPSRANISTRLGEEHKVRNFFNNLLLPRNAEHGDVTIDTHAVAAALLRPLAGGDDPVAHNFGGRGAPSSGVSGASGLYGLYADAYREAAAKRSILPREMQSITWEAIRGLFTPEFKTAANKAAVDAIWKRYKMGEISLSDARTQIDRLAGGITPPSWAVPGS